MLSPNKGKFNAAILGNVVFTKLMPHLKLQVEALCSQGRTVAFLGDGVNDMMALRGVSRVSDSKCRWDDNSVSIDTSQ